MMKALILVVLFGYTYAGNVILGGSPVLVANPKAIAATEAAIYSNAVHNAHGVAQINEAAVGQAIDAHYAALNDHANLNKAALTQEIINQDGATRNAIAAAAINNYADFRNAAIQADQIAVGRYNSAIHSDQIAVSHYNGAKGFAYAPVVYAAPAAYAVRVAVPATRSVAARKAFLRESAIIDRAFVSQKNFIRSPHFRNGVGAPVVVYNL